MMNYPKVSVVIPAHNEAERLDECLKSLQQQDYRGEYEVILIDNASTDDTAGVCAGFPDVRYVYFDRCRSSYAARNEGVRQSSAEVVLFFDADQTAFVNCISMVLAEYAAGDPHHVYCGLLEDDPRVPALIRNMYGVDRDWETRRRKLRSGQIPTSYVAVPRALYDELGGFKEDMVTGGDWEFFTRAVGVARVHVCEQAGGLHYWADTVEDLLAREERWGFAAGLHAQAQGQRRPKLMLSFVGLMKVGITKLIAAGVVPMRYRPREWLERWRCQHLHWLMNKRRFAGVLKSWLGFSRAGDLPPGVVERGQASAAIVRAGRDRGRYAKTATTGNHKA